MSFRTLLAGLTLAAAMLVPAAPHAQTTGTPLAKTATAVATFAGGCFWCMEPPFEKLDGVASVVSGFIGGKEPNPTYQQVAHGQTGHTEAVQVTYDPTKVTYEKLVDVFWRNHDPLDAGGQFCDRGRQYRPGIFVHDDAQLKVAETTKAALDAAKRFKSPIVTEITAAGPFTAAEDYHQDFYKKNPAHYYAYRKGCGRDARLDQLWGKPTN